LVPETGHEEFLMRRVLVLPVLVSFMLCATGCSSMVYFSSDPAGAKLFVNGIAYGETPRNVQLNWTTFSTFTVKLEKDGYQPYMGTLPGEPKWVYIVLEGLFCWPLLLLNAYGPRSAYHFSLRPLGEAPSPVVPAPPGETQIPSSAAAKPGEIQVYEEAEGSPRMACLEFRPGNENAREYLTSIQEWFCTGFVESRRFALIEREQIEKIFKEKKFTQTGEVDAETARELGKILGVDYLLIGSVSKLDQTFEIDARIVDVQTGKIEVASHGSSSSATRLRAAVHDIINDLNRKFTR
jgi:TolB-like protein